VRIFIEIGPAATLLGLGRRCLPDAGLAWIPSLRRDQDDCRQISEALAQMYAAGGAVDWEGVHRSSNRRRVLLPTYPFERNRHWIESGGSATSGATLDPPPNVLGILVGHRGGPPPRDAVFESKSRKIVRYLRITGSKVAQRFPERLSQCAAAISSAPRPIDSS
jgi:acyl transferase domain-containing protein